MKFLKILLISTTTLILIIAGILVFTKTKLTVGNAEFNSNYEYIYPPNCFIKFENKKYLIREIYKYNYKILNEYRSIGTEGFAVQKIEIPFEMNYNSKHKTHFFLKYSANSKFIEFDSQKYKITEKRNDTIISKINDKKIIIFIE